LELLDGELIEMSPHLPMVGAKQTSTPAESRTFWKCIISRPCAQSRCYTCFGIARSRGDTMQKPFLIRVDWDEDTAVWTADSDDIPGLATEAETLEGLSRKLESMIPELVALNSVESSDPISYELLIRRFASVRRQAA
jgi:hypothetical protein